MKIKLKEIHILLIALSVVFLVMWLCGDSVIGTYDTIKTGRIVSVQSPGKYIKAIKGYEVLVEFEDNKSLVKINDKKLSEEMFFEIYELAKENIDKELNFKIEVREYDNGQEVYVVKGLSFAESLQ